MIWILRLYPRPWRRRYGDEMAAMLEGRPFSLAAAIDLIAGAIDARLHPSATMAAAGADTREGTMLRAARFDCAIRLGPSVTRADHWKSAGVALGVTLILTPAWLGLDRLYDNNPYVESFSAMPCLLAYLVSMRYTYLKDRSLAVQAAFIGAFAGGPAAILLAAGWISAQI